MKTFTIEISGYPQEFIVSAETKEEAMDEARERWFSYTNGASIYETKVTEEHEN